MNTSIITSAGATGDDALPFLAVHYMHTCRIRHWVSQEVFIDPNFLVIKVYATIANIGIDFVPSSYPTVGLSRVNLPIAFVNGSPVGTPGIIEYMQSIVDIDINMGIPDYERMCLQTYGVQVLTDAINYALFGSQDCFSKFTSPIIHDSIPRPFADKWLSAQRDEWIHRDKELISASTWKFLKQVVSKLGWGSSRKFLFETPCICDVYLYSYLSVLLSIPDKLVPYSFLRDGVDEVEEVIHRIKTYLLDFDDWLWQLSSRRAAEHSTKFIPSARMAARGLSQMDETNDEDVAQSPVPSNNRPFLGKDQDAKKSNLIFLATTALAMIGVGYMAS
jgi:hypothetical protein